MWKQLWGKIRGKRIQATRRVIPIQVGLDFGTSCTKIVYAEVGGRLSRAVVFNHQLPHFPAFALPSVLAFGEKDELLVGIEAARFLLDKSWLEGLQRLKVLVAGRHDAAFRDDHTEAAFSDYLRRHGKDFEIYSPERLTASFLAYAMRQARKAIENSPEYGGQALDLIFNICMPIDHLQNNNVKPIFENIFSWAEAIEKEWPRNSTTSALLDIAEATQSMAIYQENPESRVFGIPEAVAEIASYLKSLEKIEGLHAIIDFGAGTTDVCIFNLRGQMGFKDEALTSFWYAARNIPWGMVNIERLVAAHLSLRGERENTCSGKEIADCIEMLGQQGSMMMLPDDLIQLGFKIKDELEKLHQSNEYYQTWGKAYKYHLKNPEKWNKVQVFVGGGGSKAPYLSQVFSEPWWSYIKTSYPVRHLPEPNNYDSIGGQAPFQRLAVAYGLAIPKPELDDYVLPDDCPDHTPPPLPIKPIPHHEEIYIT